MINILNIKDIKPNTKFRIYYSANHCMNKIIHIRAAVDEKYIVCRAYSKSKGWRYWTEWIYYFELLIEHKHLYKV